MATPMLMEIKKRRHLHSEIMTLKDLNWPKQKPMEIAMQMQRR